MQEYLQRSRLGDRLDAIGIRILTGLFSFGWFIFLWGLRIQSLLAGAALFLMLLMLIKKRRDGRVKRREKRLRERIGGELALEKMCLQAENRSHFETAMLLSMTEPITLDRMTEGGVLCGMKGKKLLISFLPLPAGDQLSARQVMTVQRRAKMSGADRAVLCVPCGVSREAELQGEEVFPVTFVDREKMISLLGRQNPATDAELVALGRRKKRRMLPRQWLQWILLPGRAKRYLLYGMLLTVLYLLTGFYYYLTPGLLCILLSAACRLRPAPRGFL